MAEKNTITKKYAKPFVLSRTKLIRMCEITKKRFETIPDKPPYKVTFQSKLQKGKEYRTENIETLFDLDNSISNRITELIINWEMGKEEDVNYTKIVLDYDSEPFSSSSIFIGGKADSSIWLNETVAELEEQVDRTIPSGIMYKIRSMSPINLMLYFMIGFITVMVGIFLVRFLSNGDSLKDNLLHLDSQNRAILLEKYKNANTTESKIDFLAELMAKAILEPKPKESLAIHINQPRTYFLIAPVLIVVAIFLYLFFYCYPTYVFEWGDWEGYHKKLIEKRKYLWSIIISSLLIGIVANLFVYGLSGLSDTVLSPK